MNPAIPHRPPEPLFSRRWFAPVIFTVLLGCSLWVMTRAWNASLLDRFQFRQTQTALTAYWIQQEGFQLAYLMPIFGPPWSAPMEFPLYQWLVSLLAECTGLSLLAAARTLGITFFLTALPAVHGLAKFVEPDSRRNLIIPAALLTAPVCLFYSRAFMIESCAAALAVWFFYAYARALRAANWKWATFATMTGIFAALVKVTTFALFGLPAAILTLYMIWKVTRRPIVSASTATAKNLTIVAAATSIPILIVTVWWITFSDGIKRSNPISEMLTSENLSTWHYGTLAQRLDPAFWKFVGHEWSTGAVSIWATLPLAAGLIVIAPSYRRAAIWCAVCFFIGPLLFTNLFTIHEYYYYPSAFFAAVSAGIVLAGLCETSRVPLVVKSLLLTVFVVLQGINFNGDYARTLKNLPAPPPPIVGVVSQATPKDGIILIYGWDWNTLIPYYAQRRAILMPPSRENNPAVLQEILGRLKPGQISALVLQGDRKRDTAFIKWCTSLLNLSSTSIAQSPDGDIYVSSDAARSLKTQLANKTNLYPGVEFNFTNPFERPDSRLIYQKPNPSDFASVTSPAPLALFTPWGIQVAEIAGHPGISANAPSEVHFEVPLGATHIEAIVGIIEGAYAGSNKTDGLDVVIFELLPTGGRRTLYQRFLNPIALPADRGLQTINLDLNSPISGTLVFALYPGPADNIAFDWGYWRKISIK